MPSYRDLQAAFRSARERTLRLLGGKASAEDRAWAETRPLLAAHLRAQELGERLKAERQAAGEPPVEVLADHRALALGGPGPPPGPLAEVVQLARHRGGLDLP